jgi:hypothetical protein
MCRTVGAKDKKARASARPAMWGAMRFWFKRGEAVTARELAAAAGCSRYAAVRFVWDLRNVGLAVCAGSWARGGAKTWRLAKDLGPACPIVRGRAVRDMNVKPAKTIRSGR